MAVTALDDSNYTQQLSGSNKTIVKYYADWCGSCKLFAPKFKRYSEDPQFAGITFVEVNAETSPEVRKQAGVTNLPFIATFSGSSLKDAAATNKEDVLREFLTNLQSA